MNIFNSKNESKLIFIFCLWITSRGFADPVSLEYNRDVLPAALKSDRSGIQAQVFGMNAGSLFADCETASAAIRLFSGFSIRQSEASGVLESTLYLLPAGQSEESEECYAGSQPVKTLPWLPAGHSDNDFPTLVCHSSSDEAADKEIVSACRLAPLSAVYEQQKSLSDTGDHNVPVDGEVAKLRVNNSTNFDMDGSCRFLVVQGARFVFSRHLFVEADDRLTSVNCPFFEGTAGFLHVVAIDFSGSNNCSVKTGTSGSNGFKGLSVDTAIVQCPRGGKTSTPEGYRSSGSDSPKKAGQADSGSREYTSGSGGSAAGAGGGDGGGGDKKKNPWSKFTDDEPVDLAELWVAYLQYLLSCGDEIQHKRGIFLLQKLHESLTGLDVARSQLIRPALSTIMQLKGGASFDYSGDCLKKAFSNLGVGAKKALFEWAARAERHIQTIANPDRPDWRHINRQGSDEISASVNKLLEKEEEIADQAFRPPLIVRYEQRTKLFSPVPEPQQPPRRKDHNYDEIF